MWRSTTRGTTRTCPVEGDELEQYRADKYRRMERRVEFLEGERERLEILLGAALRLVPAHDPADLLEAIAAAHGIDLASRHVRRP